MGSKTEIEWAHKTHSWWDGCLKCADGCKFCYAEVLDRRWHGGRHWGPKGPRRVMSDASWKRVLVWNRKALKSGKYFRVFPSICDPFEAYDGVMENSKREVQYREDGEALTMDDVRRRGFQLVEDTPGLFHMLLTKRPENVCDMVPASWLESSPDNVMICASASDQETTVAACEELRRWPGYKGLSLEPLIHEIDLVEALGGGWLDWVVIGGESNGRGCDVWWIRELVVQLSEMGLPCFVKQLGSRPYQAMDECRLVWPFGTESRVSPMERRKYVILKHKKGGDPMEWPVSLRVRELPDFMVELPAGVAV